MKITFDLNGPGGNAFHIIASARRAIRNFSSRKLMMQYTERIKDCQSYEAILEYTAQTLDLLGIQHNLEEKQNDDSTNPARQTDPME